MIQPADSPSTMDDPLKALAATAVEILHALAREVRPQLADGRLLQRLVAPHRLLRPPGEETAGVAGQRRAQRHAALTGFAVGHHAEDPIQARQR